MPRYYVIKRRAVEGAGVVSREALTSQGGVEILDDHNPDMILIEAPEAVAARLQETLEKSHYVEKEIRRGLH